jgi:hypothetical protein
MSEDHGRWALINVPRSPAGEVTAVPAAVGGVDRGCPVASRPIPHSAALSGEARAEVKRGKGLTNSQRSAGQCAGLEV